MIQFEKDVYVHIEQVENVHPKPLENGFYVNTLYRVFGIFSASETSEAYFILCNNENQFWYISNRHVRFSGIYKNYTAPHISLDSFQE